MPCAKYYLNSNPLHGHIRRFLTTFIPKMHYFSLSRNHILWRCKLIFDSVFVSPCEECAEEYTGMQTEVHRHENGIRVKIRDMQTYFYASVVIIAYFPAFLFRFNYAMY